MTGEHFTLRHRRARAGLRVAVALCASLVRPSESAAENYVGAEMCRLCHRAIYMSWLETPHARARLGPGVEQRCYKCHATAAERLEGVQCESCHGAGANYWPAEIMIDPEKAVMAGLIRPATQTCTRCHGSDQPGHEARFAIPPRAEWPRWIHEFAELEP